jgi:hypothetical protein
MTTSEPTPAAEPLLTTLDRVLRGNYLRQEQLAKGTVEVRAGRLIGLGLALGGLYGVGLGTYSLFRGAPDAFLQACASALKVPMLFLLTLLVTFPSLYVFAALQRLPLDVRSTLRLLLVAIVVHVAVIASLAPVFAFFAASTDSYEFMLLLNVAIFAFGGLLGFMVLRRATRAVFTGAPPAAASNAPPEAEADDDDEPELHPAPPPFRRAGQHDQARRVLRIWCLVYGVVGAQMGWLLRPFLGTPDLPFAWFRPREDSFFVGVLRALGALFHR